MLKVLSQRFFCLFLKTEVLACGAEQGGLISRTHVSDKLHAKCHEISLITASDSPGMLGLISGM